MKKILILQNKILHYRKPFYNEIGKEYEVTVLHSGEISVNANDCYKELIKSNLKIGPFYLQNGVLTEVNSRKYDYIVAMFDLRWINNILAFFFHSKHNKFIWWGAWITKFNIANKVRVALSKKADGNIFYTEEAKQDFLKAGVKPELLFVANNTFDVGARYKCFENSIKNSILFVGTFDKRKQNDILIEAFANVQDIIPQEIKIVFVGDGVEKEYIESLVNRSNLQNRVIFAGKINDPEKLISYYKTAYFGISFGQAGLAVLQSLGYGVPFVTKVNAISGGEKSNIKHLQNGYLCEDSSEALEETLVKLCNDLQLCRTLGRNAFDFYEKHCTIEKMAVGFKEALT